MDQKKKYQEVKNAYNAYLKIKEVNPYSIKDLKEYTGIMTYLTTEESGKFRSTGEGVFDENGNCIHICPPANQVEELMEQLFNWMKEKKNEIHPLILSSVFHYEFVFIHPFGDGNGRTARLWQNVILSEYEDIFEYVPIESAIKKYQDEYYRVIANCNANGNSTEFIEFMLKMIDEELDTLIVGVNNQINHISPYIKKLLDTMEPGIKYSTNELMKLVDMKSRVFI